MTDPLKNAELPLRPTLDRAATAMLADIESAGLRRMLRTIDSCQDPEVSISGRTFLLLCSNNYLGLASHPDLRAAAQAAIERYGTSAVSSRLISGHMRAHAKLEQRLADWKGSESALVFSTGYQANVGTITSLVGRGDVVISDELNHASIIDGSRLSRARVEIYRHNDVEHLRSLLEKHRQAERVLVITESVFSMDGDLAPLADITLACRQHGAWLMVDEAHAAGIFGPRGAGLVSELGLQDEVDVIVGTLGKALTSFGAYVSGSRALTDLLINRARAFIFTTGLPPSAVAAAHAAVDLAEHERHRAAGLLALAARLGDRLREGGLDIPNVDSQILPVLIGDADRTVGVMQDLLDDGIYVAAIRPPTVPPGTSRLRVSLMATHTDEQLERAAAAIIKRVGERTA
jgi:8-amino-7-oxononanoate synthase